LTVWSSAVVVCQHCSFSGLLCYRGDPGNEADIAADINQELHPTYCIDVHKSQSVVPYQ
jgi:hypothetical protein